ncbi:methylated-DNA--[protein]-cysteine S-methyltransferase [uncultured Jannaschia sp.]|uniref:methylated-DNA--[protein]-cysteine S-methyltransferase n=1 Tax=uncultured Jannaschia sp. TaxID=293347 RepID=UPI002631D1DF|nr:methylated-DNA--[protein]-cysteine S-methyltransferase [uncultured Jannaschia sp.]
MTGTRTPLDTPLGQLHLVADSGALAAIHWPDAPPDLPLDPDALPEVRAQLAAYFDGRLTRFDLALAPGGTPFQQEVWRALRDIPQGRTRSYGEIAAAIGRPKGAQAVGQANGANPIPIVIPCHRVVANDGGIGGFSGGLDIKRRLLAHEGAPFEAEQPRLL